MTEIAELFSYTFFQYALLGSLLASVLSGIIGTYIVSKREVFLSGGISHGAFGGIGIGYFLGWNPLFIGTLFAMASTVFLNMINQKGKGYSDAYIGVLWAVGMSVGIMFVSLTPGYAPDLMSFLFGNLLSVGLTELIVLSILLVLLLAFIVFFFYPMQFVAFDEEFAKSRAYPVAFVKLIMGLLTAGAIVWSTRVTGIILILALLTIPTLTVRMFTASFKKTMFFSSVIGFGGILGGLVLSYYYNIPTGPFVVFVLAVIFMLAMLYRKLMRL